ncbi:MAG: class I SAM-dependent methyltransferase [Candidatus Binatus sp.]|uniref:class I SAM-dependent methyltransferase n=1 Tax=Candidatus Binatus sp. TaxID=2811406 RepID=UPI00272837C1|nr:class I SAM-dependent methyltransferase [Candidatus Binatus sp.]MDO8435043.1 class I SAM-dependent methyltransferase [Candidatus Binatus sp.]
MAIDAASGDKAGEQYWNRVWQNTAPSSGRLSNHVNRAICDYLRKRVFTQPTRGLRLLELGCANSSMLPLFAREFGFEVAGIDRSPTGCEQASEVLRDASIAGDIVCGDFFEPPDRLLGAYDVVWSFGVIEHFHDTAGVVSSFVRYLRPGGWLLTMVPNMAGSVGAVLALLNRPVYDIHVILDREAVLRAHQAAGLEVIDCEYFLSTNYGVCLALGGIEPGSFEYRLKKSIILALVGTSVAIWSIEDFLDRRIPPNRLTSPYIVCATRLAS